jgi:hypothetical protein
MKGKIGLSALVSAAAGWVVAAKTAAADYANALSEWESSLGFFKGKLYRLRLIDPPVKAGYTPHSFWVGAGAAILVFLAIYAAFLVVQAFLEKGETEEV